MTITVFKNDTKELIASIDEESIIVKDGYEVSVEKGETEASKKDLT